MTTTDETASIKNDLNYIQMRLNDCYSRLEKQSAPPIIKKKTIKEIDLGWQKGSDDNCISLTFTDNTPSEIHEFDTFLDMSLCFTSQVLSYNFAPEIKITLNSQKIHSKTLMDLLKMLVQEKNYMITEYGYDARSITLLRRGCYKLSIDK